MSRNCASWIVVTVKVKKNSKGTILFAASETHHPLIALKSFISLSFHFHFHWSLFVSHNFHVSSDTPATPWQSSLMNLLRYLCDFHCSFCLFHSGSSLAPSWLIVFLNFTTLPACSQSYSFCPLLSPQSVPDINSPPLFPSLLYSV